MRNPPLHILTATLILIHFFFLHFYGISTFTTTLLFYYLIFLLLKKILGYLKKAEERKKVLLFNIKSTLIILLIAEFSCTFFFKFLNNHTENSNGIYLSPYMKAKQLNLLYQLGIIRNTRNTWEEGYEPNYKHRHETTDFNYAVTYNKDGLRGASIPIIKDSNEFRIAVIGDSFIEGYGTSEDSTFPKLLETYLSDDQENITVINGGICGSNPYSEMKFYARKIKKYQPDLILLEINNGDLLDEKPALNGGKMPLSEYFYAISHIYRILNGLYSMVILTDTQLANRIPDDTNQMIDDLIAFQRQLQENNQQFAVIYLPQQTEVHSGQPELLVMGFHKRNFPFIDLQAAYKKHIPNHPDSLAVYYWENDRHHTPAGYALMARSVADALKAGGYLKRN